MAARALKLTSFLAIEPDSIEKRDFIVVASLDASSQEHITECINTKNDMGAPINESLKKLPFGSWRKGRI